MNAPIIPPLGPQARLSATGASDVENLSRDGAYIVDDLEALQAGSKAAGSTDVLEERANACQRALDGLVKTARDLVQRGKECFEELRQRCLAVQHKFGVSRRADDPDPVKTLSVASINTSAEAFMTFSVLYGGGASVGEAFGFALLFAGVGTAVAHILGFHGLRRTNFRFRPELDAQSSAPRLRRRRGRYVIGICLVLIGLLIFSAARLRATGSLEETFDFSEVGLLATFDDGMAIALIAMAFVTMVLNTWQGLVGWSDRIYGFEEPFLALAENEGNLLEKTDELQGLVGDTCHDAIEALLERQELLQAFIDNPSDTIERLRSEVRQFNVDVHAAFEKELTVQATLNELRSIEGKPPLLTTDIEATFNALLMEEGDVNVDESALEHAHAAVAKVDDLISKIEAAEAEALARIDLAASEFSAAGAVLASQATL